MNLVSVNVSIPKTVEHLGRKVSTGIYKEPVTGRVMVRRLNVDGDGQGDELLGLEIQSPLPRRRPKGPPASLSSTTSSGSSPGARSIAWRASSPRRAIRRLR